MGSMAAPERAGIWPVTGETAPAWLVAWRERGPAPPAQPRQRTRQGGNGEPTPVSAVAEAQRPQRSKVDSFGFVEPERWPDDGGVRRETVLDMDHHPPRVVRSVGWSRCLTCGSPFFSEDVIALRLCDGPDGCRSPAPRARNEKAAANKETPTHAAALGVVNRAEA